MSEPDQKVDEIFTLVKGLNTEQSKELVGKLRNSSIIQSKGYTMDQRGNKSSKRYWAFAFGWATIAQIVSVLIILCLSQIFQWRDLPSSLTDLIKYSIGYTGILTGLCLGLTLPEWFANKV